MFRLTKGELPSIKCDDKRFSEFNLVVFHEQHYFLYFINGCQKGGQHASYKGVLTIVQIPKKIFEDAVLFSTINKWVFDQKLNVTIDYNEDWRASIRHNNKDYKKFYFKFIYSKKKQCEIEQLHLPKPSRPSLGFTESVFLNWEGLPEPIGNYKKMNYADSCKFLAKETKFITAVEQQIMIARLSE